jgi:hypothetical protein
VRALAAAKDRPTGASRSSSTLNNSRMPTTGSSGTLLGALLASGTNSRKAAPMTRLLSANFTRLDGWRRPSRTHRAANAPDRMMMKTGLIECTHETGISQPNRERSSCLSA